MTQGQFIGAHDLLIAATARHRQSAVLTTNADDPLTRSSPPRGEGRSDRDFFADTYCPIRSPAVDFSTKGPQTA